MIVLFSLYKVHANKKALMQKEKSKVLLLCKVHKKTCKHLRKTSWILVENSVTWRNRRVPETPFFFLRIFFWGGGEGHRFKSVAPQNKYATRMELIKCHTYATPSSCFAKNKLVSIPDINLQISFTVYVIHKIVLVATLCMNTSRCNCCKIR